MSRLTSSSSRLSGARRAARRRGAVLLAALAGIVAALSATSPAVAHDELIRTAPVSGATVAGPPQTVQLVFSAPVKALGSAVAVFGPGGESVTSGAPAVDGTTVDQPVRITAAGKHTVNWRIVSVDGHPVSGTFSFTVSAAPSAVAQPSSAAADPTTEAPAAADPTTEAPAAADPTMAQASEDGDGGPILPWALGIGAALAAALIAAILLSRRRTAGRP